MWTASQTPHGDKAGEQGDIAVGDVVVSHAAIGAIANMLGSQEIVLAQLHMRAVGDGGAAAAPMPRQKRNERTGR